jgi:hypothetical protein
MTLLAAEIMEKTSLEFEYFESFANEIASKFNRLQKIVGHPTTSGDYHEEILRVVLRNFLSKRYSVKKGFIYAGPGKVSKQIDLMVIDENSPVAYIFQEGDFAVVIPEAVMAIMEIKSVFNASQFDDSLENIASAKSLLEFPTNLTGIVFGYGGTEPDLDTLDKWFKRPIPTKFKSKEILTPEAIMFFSAKTLLVRCAENGRMARDGKYFHRIGIDDEGKLHGLAFQLSLILAMILYSCEHRASFGVGRMPEGIAYKSLVQTERAGLDLTRFSFGYGMSELPPKQ